MVTAAIKSVNAAGEVMLSGSAPMQRQRDDNEVMVRSHDKLGGGDSSVQCPRVDAAAPDYFFFSELACLLASLSPLSDEWRLFQRVAIERGEQVVDRHDFGEHRH